ncbi:unnamed protein product [Caenorhabditis sp. 36 PRJEB53466]|nr:unnamed protein product [Caenorhabditis sp. 36 PRJEB53466]
MIYLFILFIFLRLSLATDGFKGLYEISGFHCYSRDSMRLPRHLHGKPQTTEPPFDLSVFDAAGKRVEGYEVGKTYTVKLEAYVHFRGLMIQPRLCTPSGVIIGSLRGGKFIEDDSFETHGRPEIGFHQCGRLVTNDSLTHTGDDKKFLAEAKWEATHDVGNVQFVATIATENVLYWERWRPKHAFLKGPYQRYSRQDPNIFVYNLEKDTEQRSSEKVVTSEPILPSQHPLFEEQKEFLKTKMSMVTVPTEETSENTEDVFDFDGLAFESSSAGPVGKKIEVTAAEVMIGEKDDVTRIPEITHSSKFLIEKSVTTESSFMMGRMFKKFAPLNDTVLREDDLKFLNAHAHLHHLQHDFVDNNDLEMEEKCQENPCENGGSCTLNKGKVHCECALGYSGVNCTEIDKCIDNDCANNSTCYNDKLSHSGYSCKCSVGTVGKLCEVECPMDQCLNGGKCYLNTFGKLACKCAPGTTGRKCEREINECGWNKCQNGAKCVDLFNDYKCECGDGWMGRNCERPCQDIYGSCRVWKREGQCDEMRNATDFFDLNCAASCGVCEKLENITEFDYLPLQPILLPFAWLLGEWQSQVKGWNNHTTDYPVDMDGMVYNETVTFSVAPSLSFGTPYINYTATMTSLDDPSNVHQYNGFLTIQQYKDDNQTTDKGALTTVSNTGLIMIEEGDILDERTSSEGAPTLMLTPTYQYFRMRQGTRHVIRNDPRDGSR